MPNSSERKNLLKDNFYYSLKERLSFAQEYAINCSNRLRQVEIDKKGDYEFFQQNKFLYMFEEIVNLPLNLLRSYKIAKMKINLKKCLADIKVMQREINNYEYEALQAIIPGIALTKLWEVVSITESIMLSISAMVDITH